jgi:hypothetical protein
LVHRRLLEWRPVLRTVGVKANAEETRKDTHLTTVFGSFRDERAQIEQYSVSASLLSFAAGSMFARHIPACRANRGWSTNVTKRAVASMQ